MAAEDEAEETVPCDKASQDKLEKKLVMCWKKEMKLSMRKIGRVKARETSECSASEGGTIGLDVPVGLRW